MNGLFAEVDLTSPVSIVTAGLLAVAAAVVGLWKTSRTDKDAQLAAKDAMLKDAAERERTHIAERGQWVEIQLRSSKAMEVMASRLDALERREVQK